MTGAGHRIITEILITAACKNIIKKIMTKIISFLLAFFVLTFVARAQGSMAEKHAADISKAMKDSLKLSNKQQDDIYAINMQVHGSKLAARKLSLDRFIVSKDLQRIENSRDSLYSTVLNDKEFAEYKTKKKNLVKKY